MFSVHKLCHTDCIDILFLPSVCSYVHFKLTSHCESFFTVAALIEFLSSVFVYMCCKLIFPYKSLITVATFIWPLSGVSPFMDCKVTIVCESFVTLTALIWFLPVCVLICILRLSFSQKPLFHYLQGYDFSILCIFG